MSWPWIEKIDCAFANWQLKRCRNIADLRRAARIRIPSPIFHYMDGGAEDEVRPKRSCSSCDNDELRPRNLTDISNIDAWTTILAQPVDMPVFCSPTGMNRLFHHDGEIAVSKAAARANTGTNSRWPPLTVPCPPGCWPSTLVMAPAFALSATANRSPLRWGFHRWTG